MKNLIRLFAASGMIMLCINGKSQDWPQWRGINRDDRVTGFIAPATWPRQLTQVWKVYVGLGDATPALVGNRLYVFTRQGEKELLQCLDANTGKQIWQSEGYPAVVATGPAASHPGPRSSPAVSDGKVVTFGIGGDIACHDAANGTLLWRNESYRGAVPKFYTGMSPLVISGTCLVELGGPETGDFIAFDLASGKIKWKTTGDGPAYGSPVLLNVDGRQQVVFQTLTELNGLDPENGSVLWEYATPAGEGRTNNAASPVADNQKIYFTGLNNGVNAIEIEMKGNRCIVTKLWTNPAFSTAYNTPVLKDGFLYGLSNKGRLFCINAGDGQTAWSDDTPLQNFGSTLAAGPLLVVLSGNANLVVCKTDNHAYRQIALLKVSDNAIYAHPVLSGGNIYIKDNDSVIRFKTE